MLPQPPPELSPVWSRRFRQFFWALAWMSIGSLLTWFVTPESEASLKKTIAGLRRQLALSQQQHGNEVAITSNSNVILANYFSPAQRARLHRIARHYAQSLRSTGAQGASELFLWFTDRWEELLIAPHDEDRTTRRANTLAYLVGGMAEQIHPGDYVAWQLELYGQTWLPEVAFDADGDGYPALLSTDNAFDGFADVSVCQIAMSLNTTVLDAKILVMPDLHCDQPEYRMSLFLQGKTLGDALNHFVLSVREKGFKVVERREHNRRLILLGAPSKASGDEIP